jgi:uncharacterized protein
MTDARPQPIRTPFSDFFWEGARVNRLMIQRCAACGSYQHPPGPICTHCSSRSIVPTEVSGRGAIHSFTVVRHVFHEGFSKHVPYMLGRIELEEQKNLFLIANIVDAVPGDIDSGTKVKVVFERRGDDVLPQFTPIDARGEPP